jgi:hypothetical protein
MMNSILHNGKELPGVQENLQAMLIALGAACVGVIFDQLGTSSLFISIVGKMLIMGAFVIGITAFLLFLREWMFTYGGTE